MRSLLSTLAFTGLALSLFACGHGRDAEDEGTSEGALAEAPTPRKGNTIQSPSVNPNKDYWGARKIDELVSVGFLTQAEADVAKRADGILGNSPPNGSLGVDELASLESPAHAHALFPAERAAIPKLWSILEIAATTAVNPPSGTIQSTKVDPTFASPVELPISQLTAAYQTVAKRIQLSANRDGNDQTISGADVAAAYADKASYLPTEVATFSNIVREISNASPRLALDARRVTVANPPSQKSTLFNQGGVSAEVTTTVSIVGNFQLGSNPANAAATPKLQLAHMFALAIANNSNTKVVLLNRDTGDSKEGRTGVGFWANTHVELWSGGQRQAIFEVKTPPAPITQDIPFGYLVKLGGLDFALKCRYGATACVYAERGAPTQGVQPWTPSGAYLALPGTIRVDVFETGDALVTDGNLKLPCYPESTESNGTPRTCLFFRGTRAERVSFSNAGAAPDLPSLGIFNGGSGLYPL